MTMRLGRPGEAERLREIERAAGEAFRAIGMAAVADDPPPPAEELAAACTAGRVTVALDGAGRIVAYIRVADIDDALHVEQVSVAPEAAGRRLGASLIDHVAARAGAAPLTLTTFRDVPWNAPYYARLGFRELTAASLGPGLRAAVTRENERLEGTAARVVMRRG